MLSFRQYLKEHFINLVGDDPRKKDHADEVESLIRSSYAKIGGIHGSGFKDKQDMIKNLPMWKLKRKEGKIVSAVLYKDKSGRKSVAIATDGSEHGKAGVADIMKNDLLRGRSYGEKSSAALSFVKKHVGSDHLKKHIIPYDEVHKHLDKDDEIRKPPEHDDELQRHPEFKDHFYQRKIGNHWHTKLMLGTPGKKIK